MPADENIPADILLVLAFGNTLDERSFTRHGVRHGGGDEFATVAGAEWWLTGHGLLAAEAQLVPGELADLVILRDGLRWGLAAKAGGGPDAQVLAEINAALTGITLVLQFDAEAGQPQLVPRTRGGAAAIALLAGRIAAAAAGGSWHRLRMCAAPDCRWVFYDTSRRGGGRWCSMAVCGNRVKTRRYRQRQAQAAAG